MLPICRLVALWFCCVVGVLLAVVLFGCVVVMFVWCGIALLLSFCCSDVVSCCVVVFLLCWRTAVLLCCL